MKSYLELRQEMEEAKEGAATDQGLLEGAIDALGMATGLWEEHYDDFVERMTKEYANKTGRLPGEEARLALARQENRDLWNEYQRAERLVKKIESRLRTRNNTIKGLITEISAEKNLAEHPSYGDKPHWNAENEQLRRSGNRG